jgi:hypothetical protein
LKIMFNPKLLVRSFSRFEAYLDRSFGSGAERPNLSPRFPLSKVIRVPLPVLPPSRVDNRLPTL